MAQKNIYGDIHGVNLRLTDDVIIWDDTDVVYFLQNHIASEYDETATYNTGDIYYVHYNGLYRCTQDNVTGVWDSSECTPTTIAAELADIRANAGGTKWYQHQFSINGITYYLILPFATSLMEREAYTYDNSLIFMCVTGSNEDGLRMYFNMDYDNKYLSGFNLDGSAEFSDFYCEDIEDDSVSGI